ncbi:hypothetical protein BC937DRAFT_95125, partial [Endogone sp. FLAS-F59071]
IAQATGGSANKRGLISLNHLLNFSFPERQRPTSNNTPRKHRPANYQPFNKERFVNANFRFLVKPSGDYTVYLADPDLTIDWADIEQVMISTPETPICPICLTPPTSARVTKCGHTFCLPCILHYLQLNDNPKKHWRKCPICWDAIYARDLKSVRFLSVSQITAVAPNSAGATPIGEVKLNMRLVQRSVHSTLALPVSATWPLPSTIVSAWTNPDTVDVPWHFTPDAMQFAKFMLATPGYMDRQLTRDLDELIVGMAEVQSWNANEEVPFIQMAELTVREQLEAVRSQDTPEVAAAKSKAEAIIMAVERASAKKAEKRAQAADTPADEGSSVEETRDTTTASDTDSASTTDLTPPEAYQLRHNNGTADTNPQLYARHRTLTAGAAGVGSDDSAYFFFQAADGQHVYLHPLDIKVMKHEFGSYERFPEHICVEVLGVEESTLTEDLRKRCKYLSHLPLSCDVTFVETDLKEVVSEATLSVFADELRQRLNRRKEKARRDDKARLAAEAKERSDHELARNGGRPTSTWTTRRERDEMFEQDPFFQVNSSYPDVLRRGSDESDSHESDTFGRREGSEEGGSEAGEEHTAAAPTIGVAKTIWGTPEVSFAKVASGKRVGGGKGAWGKGAQREDEYEDDFYDFGEEQTVVSKKGKKKLVLMSTNGGRRA